MINISTLKLKNKLFLLLIPVLLLAFLLFPTNNVQAHCDSVDGPVVAAAQKAIETGDVNHVLPYVTKEGEAEVIAAFEKTMAIQINNPEVRNTINYWFYETVVRVHRQGEGAAYTGLKPAGIDYGPALHSAEEAIETGSAEELKELILSTIEKELDKKFTEVTELEASLDNVEATRERVEKELLFEKYVSQLYADATAELTHGEEHEGSGHDHGTDANTVNNDSHENQGDHDTKAAENTKTIYYILIAVAVLIILILTIRTIHKKHHKHHKCDHD